MVVPILCSIYLGFLRPVSNITENNETGQDENPRPVSPLMVGVKGICPACNKGELFNGLLDLNETCDVCGFDMRAADPGDGPAVFVILILGALVVVGMLILEFKIGVPVWVHFVLWPIVVIGGSIWMLRVLKGWIFAMQYRHDAKQGELDEGADGDADE